MRHIYLIRHADSNPNNPDYSDFDRPLSHKGYEDVSFIAKRLAELNFNPELIVCSPAQRTTTTSDLISKQSSCLYDSSIYEASLDDLIQLVNSFPNEHKNITLIGHNPAISMLANYLISDTSYHMTPCNVIKIRLEIDNWDEVTQGIGTEIFSISP